MGLAFEAVCAALRMEGSDDDVRQAIAAKVIDLARKGERNPDALCEVVLQQILWVPTRKSLSRAHAGCVP
jgi:hypothetical protein